jgi:hypothetical protein
LAAEDVGRLVKELAHALRKPAEPADFTALLPDLFADPIADANNELPQILKPKPDDEHLPRLSTWGAKPSRGPGWLARLAERLTSGAPRLMTGVGAAAMLVLASVGAINSFANLNPDSNAQLAAMSAESLPPTASATVAELVNQSKRMIDRGDISAARNLLKPAAAAGEAAAVMALAETFDPNMLAAWGARGQTADTAAAKMLYAEALLAGVIKARQRLEALKDTP